MFRVNRQTDYAIRVVLALARRPEGARVAASVLGEEMLIPRAFLSRIVAQLAEGGLIKTFAGRNGGLQLARPAGEMTLRQVIEIIEGPFLLSECMLGENACPFEHQCPVRGRWSRLQRAILDELERTTFAELAAEASLTQGVLHILPVQS